MSGISRFHRLVLELGHGAADVETMRQAIAFARLLDAELHALFVEDETLLRASALPFTREISAVSYQWRPLDRGRMESDLRAVAQQARTRFEAAASAAGVRRGFEVHRGDLALRVTELCAASDIVVIAPPGGLDPGTMFQQLRDTAHRSAASVLFLPRRGPPAPGGSRAGNQAIVAVVSGPDDPGLAIARRIAAQSRARLLVLTRAPLPDEAGVAVRHFSGGGARDITAALGDTRERLIVMTREPARDESESDNTGSALAAARGVPVLMLEP
jgi:hypothetical protein